MRLQVSPPDTHHLHPVPHTVLEPAFPHVEVVVEFEAFRDVDTGRAGPAVAAVGTAYPDEPLVCPCYRLDHCQLRSCHGAREGVLTGCYVLCDVVLVIHPGEDYGHFLMVPDPAESPFRCGTFHSCTEIDLLCFLRDGPNLASTWNSVGYNLTQVGQWHNIGKPLYIYAYPQVGVENPEIYRNNYGVALWNAGYDGSMNWAYQGSYNNIWNDFDSASTHYRDHIFAYPTSNGVIDTIQWEGFREGVDDTRYVASLIEKEGSVTSAKSIVSAGLANKENMTSIRKKVIDQILISTTPTPTPTPTLTPVPTTLIPSPTPTPVPTLSPTPVPTTSPVPSDTPTPIPTTIIPTPSPTPISARVSASSITITAPNGGGTWKRGSKQTIAWNYTGNPGSKVKIVLLKAGVEVGTIKDSWSIGRGGKGSYSWPISPAGLTGSDYKVSIQSIRQPTIKDASNNYVNIIAGKKVILKPSGKAV